MSLAFVLLVLMGVSGVAVLDPALGVWSVVASGRADAERAARVPATVVRIGATRDAHAEQRLASSNARTPALWVTAPDDARSSDAGTARSRARLGHGALPPPVAC